jgi:hypothetical protein
MMLMVFVAEGVWIEATPNIIYGIWNTGPIVKANPQLWVAEIFDGFGPHTSFLQETEMPSDSRIVSVKEEGYSSLVNQANDNYIVVMDKIAKKDRKTYLFAHQMFYNKGVADQWGMVVFACL